MNMAETIYLHPRTIRRGVGRVIYAPAQTTTAGQYLPEGWALPGGERTVSQARAEAVADNIDRITRGNP
jgi:hypothetical protein